MLTEGRYWAAVAGHVCAELRQLLTACMQLRLRSLAALLLNTASPQNSHQQTCTMSNIF